MKLMSDYKKINILVVTSNAGLTFNVVRILNKMSIKPYILDSTNKPLYSLKIFSKKYYNFNYNDMLADNNSAISFFRVSFIFRINEICKKHNINVVLPVDLASIITVSKYRDELDDNILLPPTLDYNKIFELRNII
jgi:hypothetical protein